MNERRKEIGRKEIKEEKNKVLEREREGEKKEEKKVILQSFFLQFVFGFSD